VFGRGLIKVGRKHDLANLEKFEKGLLYQAPPASNDATAYGAKFAFFSKNKEPFPLEQIVVDLNKIGFEIETLQDAGNTFHVLNPLTSLMANLKLSDQDLEAFADLKLTEAYKVYLAADGRDFCFTNNRQQIMAFFAKESREQAVPLFSDPQFLDMQKALPYDSKLHYSYQYVDYAQAMKSMVGSTLAGSSPDAVVVQDTLQELNKFVDDFPLKGMLSVSGFNQGFLQKSLLYVDSKEFDLQRWLTFARGSAHAPVTEVLPAEPMFAAELSGALLQGIKAGISQIEDPDFQADVVAELGILDSIHSIGYSVSYARGLMAMPPSVLAIRSSQPQDVVEFIKSIPEKVGVSEQLGAWKQKTIAGGSVEYVISPPSIPIILASHGNVVFVSNSETKASEVFKLLESQTGGLAKELRDRSAEDASQAIGFIYINAQIIGQAARDMLGMFLPMAGLDATLASEISSIVESLGVLTTQIKRENKYLLLESRLYEPQAST
jgi:hypothetical protein